MDQQLRPLRANDIPDVGFLAVAVPYCDILMTERFWRDAGERIGLNSRYGTLLIADYAS